MPLPLDTWPLHTLLLELVALRRRTPLDLRLQLQHPGLCQVRAEHERRWRDLTRGCRSARKAGGKNQGTGKRESLGKHILQQEHGSTHQLVIDHVQRPFTAAG